MATLHPSPASSCINLNTASYRPSGINILYNRVWTQPTTHTAIVQCSAHEPMLFAITTPERNYAAIPFMSELFPRWLASLPCSGCPCPRPFPSSLSLLPPSCPGSRQAGVRPAAASPPHPLIHSNRVGWGRFGAHSRRVFWRVE